MFIEFKELIDSYTTRLDELKARVNNVSAEVKSVKKMLEKSINTWTKYDHLYEELNKWLSDRENQIDLDKVSKTCLFYLTLI